jgi:TetR/AcrR family transcriptional regulator, cholesterol catabolism regulator
MATEAHGNDNESTRERILRVAKKGIEERGVDRVSMNYIADECQISKAALYHHYESKAAIVIEIYNRVTEAMWATIDRADLERDGAALTLEKLIAQQVAYHASDHRFLQSIWREWNSLPRDSFERIRRDRRRYDRFVREVIQKGVENLEFEVDDIDVVALATEALLSTVHRWADRVDMDAMELGRLVAGFVLHGLRYGTPRSQIGSWPLPATSIAEVEE